LSRGSPTETGSGGGASFRTFARSQREEFIKLTQSAQVGERRMEDDRWQGRKKRTSKLARIRLSERKVEGRASSGRGGVSALKKKRTSTRKRVGVTVEGGEKETRRGREEDTKRETSHGDEPSAGNRKGGKSGERLLLFWGGASEEKSRKGSHGGRKM